MFLAYLFDVIRWWLVNTHQPPANPTKRSGQAGYSLPLHRPNQPPTEGGKLMKTVLKIVLFLIGLYLFLLTAPKPGIDCSRYHSGTFHGVYVGCGGGK